MADVLLERYIEALDEFPLTGSADEKLRAAVKYAVLAPSSHNAQPWLFRVASGTLDLYADRSRGLPVVDPKDRELVISCGAALFNLETGLRDFGCRPVVTLFPDAPNPDLLARVSLDGQLEASDEDRALFLAIRRRHTHRLPFAVRPVDRTLLTLLEIAAVHHNAWLKVIEGDEPRAALADLVAEGDRRQMADRRFRRELAAWMHPNRTRSRDGIPGYALGFHDVMAAAGPLVVRTFDMGKGQAARDRELALGSPVLAVLGTARDSQRDWLAAGRALEHVLLRAAVEGVTASYLNQPIEVPELRFDVQVLTGFMGYPQLVLRLGYDGDARPTPRRPVEEVVLD
jgi:nitroreductase